MTSRMGGPRVAVDLARRTVAQAAAAVPTAVGTPPSTLARNAEATASRPAPSGQGPARLELIDRLRGLVIVLMVLDHVREYFSADAFQFEATDLAQTTPVLFATRWVTHLCAPTFVFLAGASAYLQRAGARDRSRVARFLVTRGLWLIALELTVIGFGIHFAYPFFFFQVIWAIGIGLVVLGALLWVPPAAVLALGVLVVAGHSALSYGGGSAAGALLWRLLMQPGPLPAPLPGVVAYPALPWLGVMCLGYGLGSMFTWSTLARRRVLLVLGAGALALFLALRALNGYGDPAPWRAQPNDVFTVLSFLKVSKYPPSLLFVLATLGLALPLGVALDQLRGPVGGLLGRVLLAFGRTPLFTYLVHLYVVHGLALAGGLLSGVPAVAFTHFLNGPERLRDAGWGVGLPAVYAIWVAVLVALYPIARWYAARKEERGARWMRYL